MIVPGSGDQFYCQNCERDAAWARALRRAGCEVVWVPMYLPAEWAASAANRVGSLYFGALRAAAMHALPRWLARRVRAWHWLDHPALLRWVARWSASVDPGSGAGLTVAVLRGEEGPLAEEVKRLADWLGTEIHPDVVVLGNALLSGLAGPIQRRTGARVIGCLQDEDVWLDAMPTYWREQADRAIAAVASVTIWIALTRSYAERACRRWQWDPEKVVIIPPALEGTALDTCDPPPVPTLGFYARLTPTRGLDTVIRAWEILRQSLELGELRLRLGGGATREDRQWLERRLQGKDRCAVALELEYERARRPEFWREITVLSVPARVETGGGLQILEAMAAGVPVVQPRGGAFSEWVEQFEGGRLYEPDTPEALAEAVRPILTDRELRFALGSAGRRKVPEACDPDRVAARWWSILQAVRDRA